MVGRLYHLGKKESRLRAGELLDRFDLSDAAKRPAKTYSGGMRRRLDIAASLIARPRVLFLDEPTTGLDPRSRRTMWDIVRGLVADGVSILLTTQYLDEADQLADRIGVLDGGRLVAEGTAAELKRLVPGATFRLTFRDRPVLESAAAVLTRAAASPETLTLAVPSDGSLRSLKSVLGTLDAASIEADHLMVDTPDLDDVFLALTGRTTEDSRTAEEKADIS
jgi:ABC-2 type transport system ATP-binding protein